MRYYFFDRYFGHDRVAQAEPLAKVKPGDFFEARGIGYAVCLGESVTWMEQYEKFREPQLWSVELIHYGQLFSEQTLELLHWFTQHRFCWYKKAIPLWVGNVEELAKRQTRTSKKKTNTGQQQLLIYPHVWALVNDPGLDGEDPTRKVLTSQTTKKQKAESYRAVQAWTIQTIACTYSQMFLDRKTLTKITVYHQHYGRYKNQQDPRYQAVQVVKKMAEVYGAELDVQGIAL